MRRPWLAFAIAVPALLLAPPLLQPAAHQAEASVAIALSMDKLAGVADSVGLADPLESISRWEEGRIITLTRMRLVEQVAGESPQEFWVRSLGGEVDGIGQLVEGEPTFAKGQRVLVFLKHTKRLEAKAPVGLVVGRTQGMFLLRTESSGQRLRAHADLGKLLPARVVGPLALDSSEVMPAWEYLPNRPLRDALREVRAAWQRQHPVPSAK